MTHKKILLVAAILQVCRGQIQTATYRLQPNSLQYYYPAAPGVAQGSTAYPQQVAYAPAGIVGHYAPATIYAMVPAPQHAAVPAQGHVQYLQLSPAYSQPPQQIATAQISQAPSLQPHVAAPISNPAHPSASGVLGPNTQYNFQYQVQHAPVGDSKFQFETRNGDLFHGASTYPVPGFAGRALDYNADLLNRYNAVDKEQQPQQKADPTSVTITKSLELQVANVPNALPSADAVSGPSEGAVAPQPAPEAPSTPPPVQNFAPAEPDISRSPMPISAPPQVQPSNFAPVSTSTPSPVEPQPVQVQAQTQAQPVPQQYNMALQYNYVPPIIQQR